MDIQLTMADWFEELFGQLEKEVRAAPGEQADDGLYIEEPLVIASFAV